MCTLSWAPIAGGYLLGFNRDESRVRSPELPVAPRRSDEINFLAPLDGDQLGTWIAANEFGVTLALLNRYQSDSPRQTAPVSRGRLVLALASAADPAGVRHRLTASRLDDFRQFTLAVTGPDAPVHLFEWDGFTLQERTVRLPGVVATSSAIAPVEAEAARRRALAEIQAGGPLSLEVLDTFHRSHLPARGGLSPCMHRDDAETRSFCRVTVTGEAVELRHTSGAPCTSRESVVSHLARRPQPLPNR